MRKRKEKRWIRKMRRKKWQKKRRTRKKQQRRCGDKISAGSIDMEEWLRVARKRRVAVRSVK